MILSISTQKILLTALLCLCFVIFSGTAFAQRQSSDGIIMTTSLLDNGIPPAINAPIWLDVQFTNTTRNAFDLDLMAKFNYSSLITDQPVDRSLILKCLEQNMEGIGTFETIMSGENTHIHVLVNDFLQIHRTGNLSGFLLFAINGDVKTVAFSLKIGAPLTSFQMRQVMDIISGQIESADWTTHREGLRSVALLPDSCAVPTLMRVINSVGNSRDEIEALGNRPRTEATTKALQVIVDKNDPYNSTIANGYLTQTSANSAGSAITMAPLLPVVK